MNGLTHPAKARAAKGAAGDSVGAENPMKAAKVDQQSEQEACLDGVTEEQLEDMNYRADLELE